MNDPHPAYADALAIISQLEAAGYEAFFVGGAARDLLLKRSPHDLDIVTNAPPDATQQIFPRHTPVGALFGIVGVVTDHGVIDVATYRSESDYADRRRPTTVSWSTKEADVQRRDFTVNGLLYDPTQEQIVDLVDGERDLKLGLIRAIGDPTARFREDPVRLLRAVRLKAQLRFQYDLPTYQAIKSLARELAHVANERIRTELDRMLALPNRVEALADLDELGLLEQALPEIAKLHGVPQPRQYHREGDVFAHTLLAVGSLEPTAPTILIWAVLLHDVAKPLVLTLTEDGHPSLATPTHAERSAALAVEIATRLKFPAEERETLEWLIHHHMSLANIESMRPAKRERFLGDPRFLLLLELHKADVLGTEPSDLGLYEHDLALYRAAKTRHATHGSTAPPPLVTGHDLIRELDITEGPQVGDLLEKLRDAQLLGRIKTKAGAIQFLAGIIDSGAKY